MNTLSSPLAGSLNSHKLLKLVLGTNYVVRMEERCTCSVQLSCVAAAFAVVTLNCVKRTRLTFLKGKANDLCVDDEAVQKEGNSQT